MDVEEDVLVLVGVENKEKQENLLNVVSVTNSGAIRMNVESEYVNFAEFDDTRTKEDV